MTTITDELLHAAAVAIRDAYEDYPTVPFTEAHEWHDEARAVLNVVAPLIARAARADELHAIANQLLGRPAKLPSIFTTPSVALVSEYGVLAEEFRARAALLSAPTEEN